MAKLDRDARRTSLLASPLFQAMQPSELDTILDMAADREVRRGQTIFQKGDEGSSMMAVQRGRVRIGANSSDGREITLNTINPGEVFGEIALLDGKPRSADAVAVEDSTLLVLERRHFLPFLLANNDLMLRMLMVVCQRLRQTSVALEDIALFDLPERLARVLLKLADDYGRKTTDGVRIDVRLSQKDLSNLVAATRESVNKQLSVWRGRGVLVMDGNYIILRQRDELEDLVELRDVAIR
jgi:CRP/FNR family cyclic AMP-dependent transcriptional regulator